MARYPRLERISWRNGGTLPICGSVPGTVTGGMSRLLRIGVFVGAFPVVSETSFSGKSPACSKWAMTFKSSPTRGQRTASFTKDQKVIVRSNGPLNADGPPESVLGNAGHLLRERTWPPGSNIRLRMQRVWRGPRLRSLAGAGRAATDPFVAGYARIQLSRAQPVRHLPAADAVERRRQVRCLARALWAGGNCFASRANYGVRR